MVYKIIKGEAYYDISDGDAEFSVFLYFPKSTRLYNKRDNEPTFCEFGYNSDKDDVKIYVYNNGHKYLFEKTDTIESAEWTTHLIGDVYNAKEKYVNFNFRVWLFDDEDYLSASEHFNDKNYWKDIFEMMKQCPIEVPVKIQESIITKWNEFIKECKENREEV